MHRSDVTRINTELERMGRKEELLLQLMLEKMKQAKEAKDLAKKAADKAVYTPFPLASAPAFRFKGHAFCQVQSEGSEEEKNDRVLGELRHSDIDTLVCWRESQAAAASPHEPLQTTPRNKTVSPLCLETS